MCVCVRACMPKGIFISMGWPQRPWVGSSPCLAGLASQMPAAGGSVNPYWVEGFVLMALGGGRLRVKLHSLRGGRRFRWEVQEATRRGRPKVDDWGVERLGVLRRVLEPALWVRVLVVVVCVASWW